jgi:hypothetical protein
MLSNESLLPELLNGSSLVNVRIREFNLTIDRKALQMVNLEQIQNPFKAPLPPGPIKRQSKKSLCESNDHHAILRTLSEPPPITEKVPRRIENSTAASRI